MYGTTVRGADARVAHTAAPALPSRMLIDSNDIADGTELRAHVCVVGAGAAGIAMALRLRDLAVDTVVVESGGTTAEPATQALYAGRADHYYEPEQCRLRYLGGTTNHFGGQSRPFDEADFHRAAAPGLPGWPIPRAEALRELDAAARMMGLPPGGWTPSEHFGPPTATTFRPTREIEPVVFQGAAVRMGPVYRPALVRSTSVKLLLHANVTQIRLTEDKARVDHLALRTLAGNRFRVRARQYVLATGGIEVVRLLLDCDDAPGGLGNRYDLVGRYFADHPALPMLPLQPGPVAAPQVAPRWKIVDGMIPGLQVSAVEMLATTETVRRAGAPALNASLYRDGQDWAVPGVEFDERAGRGVADLLQLPGVDGRNPPAGRPALFTLVAGFEQIPNPASRVTLLSERNAVGDRQVRVTWRLTDDDETNISQGLRILAAYLAASGIGSLLLRPQTGRWIDVVQGQYHHLGTTRMADSPRAGVVDRDLRVHGVPNLSIASSAVFPVYGHVNPTLNLISLALRLANRVASEARA
jgi:choline dehydrogenase-like flavoprotein